LLDIESRAEAVIAEKEKEFQNEPSSLELDPDELLLHEDEPEGVDSDLRGDPALRSDLAEAIITPNATTVPAMSSGFLFILSTIMTVY